MSDRGRRCIHLGLDLLFLLPGESGGRETYARELLAAMRSQRPDLEVTAFLNTDTAGAGAGFWTALTDRVVPVRASPRSRARWAGGQLALLSGATRRAGVDLLHSPANVAPLWASAPRVVTVHDLLFGRRATRALVRRAAASATAMITGSRTVRDELVEVLQLDARRVTVIPHGVSPPPAPSGDLRALRERHRFDERPVTLMVGADLPHKNLDIALRGLAVLPAADRPVLVCVGRGTDGPRLRELAHALGVQEQTRLLGTVGADELELLYRSAALLVSPSLGEGFGLTPLEAMARGVPVACADIPVSREVVADCALFFDPHDPAAVARALLELSGGGPGVRCLVERGLERATSHTWSAAAARTLTVYDAALAA